MMGQYVDIFVEVLPFLLTGLWRTVVYSIFALVLGSVLGISLGLLRSLRLPIVHPAIGLYLHIFRGSPFLVQLYVVYFVLPNVGIELVSLSAGILALTLYASSYITEIAAASIEAVPRGQTEAARSCGMGTWQTYRYILIPQAMRMMLPPLASVYVIVVKSTSLFSMIGLSELMRVGFTTAQREPAYVFLIYVIVAGLYFVYCYPILRFARWAEHKVGSHLTEIL